jgi:hypothetical protein
MHALGRCMSIQRLSTEYWEACLPETWAHVEREPDGTVYFESPDHATGVYLSTWRANGQSLADALRDTRAIELRNLPPSDAGRWEIIGSAEPGNGPVFDTTVEYLNRLERHRIVSRLLGRGDQYVRLCYHDYKCEDANVSARQSAAIISSLVLKESS